MGNKLFVVLHSVDHETMNEFRGVFVEKKDAFEFAKKLVRESIRPEQFVLEDGRWSAGHEEIEVHEVEVGVPFERKVDGWVRE